MHHVLAVQVVYTLHNLFYHLFLLFELFEITACEKKREFLERRVFRDCLGFEVDVPLERADTLLDADVGVLLELFEAVVLDDVAVVEFEEDLDLLFRETQVVTHSPLDRYFLALQITLVHHRPIRTLTDHHVRVQP